MPTGRTLRKFDLPEEDPDDNQRSFSHINSLSPLEKMENYQTMRQKKQISQIASFRKPSLKKQQANQYRSKENQILKKADITISNQGVRILLDKINPNKETGPDQICEKLPKELSCDISIAITYIFQKSLDKNKISEDGKHGMSVLSLKKVINTMQ